MTETVSSPKKTTPRDMTRGPIALQVLLFALPLMLGNIFTDTDTSILPNPQSNNADINLLIYLKLYYYSLFSVLVIYKITPFLVVHHEPLGVPSDGYTYPPNLVFIHFATSLLVESEQHCCTGTILAPALLGCQPMTRLQIIYCPLHRTTAHMKLPCDSIDAGPALAVLIGPPGQIQPQSNRSLRQVIHVDSLIRCHLLLPSGE